MWSFLSCVTQLSRVRLRERTMHGGKMAMRPFRPEAARIQAATSPVYGSQSLVSHGEPDYDIELPVAEHPSAEAYFVPGIVAIARDPTPSAGL